ncbi:MAG: hypothetical protein AMK69_28935 [Nitrospira bacterium SG8_3]|nr:MAG: hypothetical protein AMK69_28935 [Nitrospira bacterium SG8_3]
MKKLKYEKPIIKKLGYEGKVVEGACDKGPGFKTSCSAGPRATNCTAGTEVSPAICSAGTVVAS